MVRIIHLDGPLYVPSGQCRKIS